MKKAQFSVEYLLIVGFALVIIIPVVYYSYSSFSDSQQEIAEAAVNKIGYDIVNTAKNVYFLGQDSRVTVDMTFPDGIQNFDTRVDTLADPDQYFLFIQIHDSEILFPSAVELRGSFIPENYAPGLKHVKLQSYGTYVEVSIT